MNSRNWVNLFLSTLLIGGIVTGVAGLIVRWTESASIFVNFQFLEILSVFIWYVGVGLIFSLISQMGYFAYLTVHRIGLSIFKSHFIWNGVQIILIFVALFDLVYLRYNAFAEDGGSLLPYIGPAVLIMVFALAVATIKTKFTNKQAFIPAVFFMIVITMIEWVPALRINDQTWMYLMVFPLLICNAYQLIILQKLNEKSQLQRQALSKKPSA